MIEIRKSENDKRKKEVLWNNNICFESIKELDRVIKIFLKESKKNTELIPEIIIDLINSLHPGVKKHNQKCISIKILNWDGQIGEWDWVRERFGGGIFVIGFFIPYNKWHGVTVYPHKTEKKTIERIKTALREKFKEFICIDNFNEVCEECNRRYPQLHHDSKSFKEVFDECMDEFSESEKENGFDWDWWKHEQDCDAISNDHDAVKKMFKLHKKIKYKWLCKECHIKYHGELE
jgi:hypothetical protein